MSEVTSTAETTEIEKSTYLDRFTHAGLTKDRSNIEEIAKHFLNTLQGQSRKGTLHAIGGTVNKPLPRKDIDLIMTLEPQEGDPMKIENEDQISFELRQFELFKSITGEMLKDTKFKEIKYIPPTLDDDYAHLGIIKNNGIIEINTGEMPIQIIVNPTEKTLSLNPESPAILLANNA